MTAPLLFAVDLPPAGLSPNRKSSVWQVEARVRAAYLEECVAELEKAIAAVSGRLVIESTPWRVARVTVTGRYRVTTVRDGRYRPIDEPNLIAALKPAFDALTKVGAIVDDDFRHMRLGEPEIVPVAAGEREYIELRVERWRGPRGRIR